jgi:hypothetical protein
VDAEYFRVYRRNKREIIPFDFSALRTTPASNPTGITDPSYGGAVPFALCSTAERQ